MKVVIDSLDHNGRGIARVDNKVTFVDYALAGEEVEIEIVKEKKYFNEAKLIKVINKSKSRVEPVCPYFMKCGGCDLLHMSYDEELIFKKEKIINILKKYVGLDVNVDIVSSDKIYNYRNKLTLHNNGKLGMMSKKSNTIINIDYCYLVNDLINNYYKNTNTKHDLVIRCNENEVISTKDDYYLLEYIGNYKYRIDIKSFFQVNNYISEEIFKYIKSMIDKCNVALDLYSGVGTLTMLVASEAKKVYSIEVNKYSCENQLYNIELNKVKNITLLSGKVEDRISEINEKVDLIVSDPPRDGMDKVTLDAIKKFKPSKIVYMSCEPLSLARDLGLLLDEYELSDIKAFDMFPRTKHVECVCVLNRR